MQNKNEWLQRLTGQLYEGVLTDEGWSEALRTISQVTDSPQASVVVFDTQSQTLAINESFGTVQEAVAAYNAHYHRLDDALAWASRAPLVGGWYLDRRDLGEAAMRRSEYYQDFMLRYGMASALCNRVAGDGGMDAYLSLQRRPGQPHYSDAELAAFGQFIPHVQRAVRMRMHMQRLAERAGIASVVLDQLRAPLLVLDAQGCILHGQCAGRGAAAAPAAAGGSPGQPASARSARGPMCAIAAIRLWHPWPGNRGWRHPGQRPGPARNAIAGAAAAGTSASL